MVEKKTKPAKKLAAKPEPTPIPLHELNEMSRNAAYARAAKAKK